MVTWKVLENHEDGKWKLHMYEVSTIIHTVNFYGLSTFSHSTERQPVIMNI